MHGWNWIFIVDTDMKKKAKTKKHTHTQDRQMFGTQWSLTYLSVIGFILHS